MGTAFLATTSQGRGFYRGGKGSEVELFWGGFWIIKYLIIQKTCKKQFKKLHLGNVFFSKPL